MSDFARTPSATPRRQNSDPAMRTSSPTRFPPVKLTEQQLDAFHGAAHKALSQTVKEFVKLDGRKPIDTQRWRYMRSRNGASVYHDHQQVQDAHSTLLVAGTFKARLADVLDGLYMDTTEDTRLVQHRIHPRFVDAQVLSVIEQRSPEHPFNFTGLKWALLKSSNSGIVSNRDICFLEKLGTIAVADGRRLGYFIMQSVNLNECPPSLSAKVVRAHISLCYLFEETSNGLVGVYMTGNMVSFGPKMLWKMARNNFADIVLSIGNAVDIARAKRCMTLLSNDKRVGSSQSSSSAVCDLCHCLPSFFDRHRPCAGCQKKNVCKKCRVKQEIFRGESDASSRLARASFCFECVESVRSPHHVRPKSVAAPREHLDGFPKWKSYDCEPRRRVQFSGNSRRTGVHKNGSIGSASSTSTTTASEGGSLSDLERDSERSLGLFMQKVRDQLDDVKYDQLDVTSRLSELAMLGSGQILRDACLDSDSDNASARSALSSAFSVCDIEMDALDHDTEDDEEVQSVRLVRRSLQPPEMLQAQKLSWDGSLRSPTVKHTPPKAASLSLESQRDLISRLERASRLAEHTHRLTKEQARRHEQRLYFSPGERLGSVTL